MNAEVTAENRPVCHEHKYHVSVASLQTHEYQGCVQIYVVLLREFFVVFFGLLAVVLVEFSTKILLVPPCLVSRAVGDILEWIRRGDGG